MHMERVIAFLIFILCLPFLGVLYFLYKITAFKEPFLFLQKRSGKDGHTFMIYKIRTMKVGAESLRFKYQLENEADGPIFKMRNDPRYIRCGKFLSSTGIDELPQLFNIMKGEMTFVGPRPLPIYEARRIPRKYKKRFTVLPGITSLWVINGSHSLGFRKWMELDMKYINYRSLGLDIKIVFSTVYLMLKLFIMYLFPDVKKKTFLTRKSLTLSKYE